MCNMNTNILGSTSITVGQVIKYSKMIGCYHDKLEDILPIYKTYSEKYNIRFDVASLMFLYYGMKTNWSCLEDSLNNIVGIGLQPALVGETEIEPDGSIKHGVLEEFVTIELCVEAHCQILNLITKKTTGALLENVISKNAPLIAFQDITIPSEIKQPISSELFDVFYLGYIWFTDILEYDTTIYSSFEEAHENKDTFGWFLETGCNSCNIIRCVEENITDDPSTQEKIQYFIAVGSYNSFKNANIMKGTIKSIVAKYIHDTETMIQNNNGFYELIVGYFRNRLDASKIQKILYTYGYYGRIDYKINENV